MSDLNDEKHLLLRAASELRHLRQENIVLSAKVEVMDLFALVLNTKPNCKSQGMSIDVVWEMEQRIAEIEREAKRD